MVLANQYLGFSQYRVELDNCLSKVKKLELPIKLSEEDFGIDQYKHGLKQGKSLGCFYENLSENYFYFVHSYFETSDLIGVIIYESGAAGGNEERFHLFLYNKMGTLEDKLIIGQNLADCSSTLEEFSLISTNLNILKTTTYFSVDCLTEEELLKKVVICKYVLKNKNKFEILE